MGIKVLIADDEVAIRNVIAHFLKKLGFQADTADGFQSAISQMKAEEYDIVITDKNMPHFDDTEESGISLLEYARKYHPTVEILLMTGYPTIDSAIESMKLGAFDYLIKPFSMEDLKKKIDRILEYKSFVNPENVIKTYKAFHNQILDLLTNKESLTLEAFHSSVIAIDAKIDHFFKAQQKWGQIALAQRESLDNITNYSEQLMDCINKEAPFYGLVKKIYEESQRGS